MSHHSPPSSGYAASWLAPRAEPDPKAAPAHTVTVPMAHSPAIPHTVHWAVGSGHNQWWHQALVSDTTEIQRVVVANTTLCCYCCNWTLL